MAIKNKVQQRKTRKELKESLGKTEWWPSIDAAITASLTIQEAEKAEKKKKVEKVQEK